MSNEQYVEEESASIRSYKLQRNAPPSCRIALTEDEIRYNLEHLKDSSEVE